MIKDVENEVGPDQLVADYFQDTDIVITEGYKTIGKPQIEVFRSTAHDAPLHVKGEKKHLDRRHVRCGDRSGGSLYQPKRCQGLG